MTAHHRGFALFTLSLLLAPLLVGLLLPLLASADESNEAVGDRGRYEKEQPRYVGDPDLPPAEWVLREAPVLEPEETVASFDLAPGYRAEVVAAEPLVEDPIAIAFGADGRLWVAEIPSYNWKYRPVLDLPDEPPPPGRVVVLEDTTDDGRFDQRTVFLDDLKGPRALAPVADGLLVADPPRVYFCRDTTGDGKADEKTEVIDDFGTRENPHSMASGLMRAMDNWIYSAGYTQRLRWNDGTFRIDGPIVSRGQWGLTQDNFGRLIFNRQSDPLRGDVVRPAYWRRNAHLPDNHAGINLRFAEDRETIYTQDLTPGVNQREMLADDGWLARFTSSGGPAVYRGGQFPADTVGDVFVCVPAANFIRRFRLHENDDGRIEADNAHRDREFLYAYDERFRPVHAYTGPDGALYVVDMYRGIIEGEPWMTDITRDYKLARSLHKPFKGLGRVYRIVHEDRPAGDWPNMIEHTPEQWVEHLSHPNGWWRDTAQRLLIEHASAEAEPALRQLAGDTSAEPYARLHALWTLEGLEALDAAVVVAALADPSPRVREAGLRLAEPFLDDADVRAAAIALADDERTIVRRQLMFTLGETDAEEAEATMRRMLHRDGGTAYMTDAALSGLQGRELRFLRDTLTHADWQEAPAGGERLVRRLAEAITNEGDAANLAALVGLLGGDGWWPTAILAGMEEGDTANLANADAALRVLLDLPDAPAERRQRATALVASIESEPDEPGEVDVAELDDAVRALYERGRTGYMLCAACHQADGSGQADVAPALMDSPWLEGEPEPLIGITLHGLTGRDAYPPMAPLAGLDDEQLAAILTYLRLTLADAEPIHPDDIAAAREQFGDRFAPWTTQELEALAD